MTFQVQDDGMGSNEDPTPNTLVLASNTAPTFAGATNGTLPELAAFTRDLGPTDADVPSQPLTVSLVSGPEGLTVSGNGVLAWMPTEVQGPSTNAVSVRVTDGMATVTNAFTLVVLEVNALPTLAGATNAVVNELAGYTQALVPMDSDVPVQSLTVSLVSGPGGLVVTNGVLAWTPTELQRSSTNVVVVSVGDGVATVTNVFTAVVLGHGGGLPGTSPAMEIELRDGGVVKIQVRGADGELDSLELEASDDLKTWRPVVDHPPKRNEAGAAWEVGPDASHRFYRVRRPVSGSG
jgi:hypothetical protein